MKPATLQSPQKPAVVTPPSAPTPSPASNTTATPLREIGGRRQGLEPTRYGDWEKNGRCIDF